MKIQKITISEFQQQASSSVKLKLRNMMLQNHIDRIKQLEERITDLELRFQSIEGEKPCEVNKPITFEQYQNFPFNSEEAFLQEALLKPFPEVLAIR